ncbi:MAG: hypothetical protein ACE5GW_09115, partial [Planctomycetota bacterium]
MNGGEGIAGAPARGRLASRFLFIAMILIAGFTAPRAAPCQDAARLEARIALGHPWVRENAPVPVRITMKGNEPRPRAGRLQIDFDD